MVKRARSGAMFIERRSTQIHRLREERNVLRAHKWASTNQTKAEVSKTFRAYGTQNETASRSRATHLVSQPGAGESPIAHHSSRRDLQSIGGFFNAESAKKP